MNSPTFSKPFFIGPLQSNSARGSSTASTNEQIQSLIKRNFITPRDLMLKRNFLLSPKKDLKDSMPLIDSQTARNSSPPPKTSDYRLGSFDKGLHLSDFDYVKP